MKEEWDDQWGWANPLVQDRQQWCSAKTAIRDQGRDQRCLGLLARTQ